jgi:dTDP-4-dehydrorhamnose reductase
VKRKLKVLVTGANGLLGTKVVEKLQKNGYEVVPTHRSIPLQTDSIKLDITEEKAVNDLMIRIKPSVVVHTAAETNVDLCEKEPLHAYKVNVEATRNLAIASQKAKAKTIYISTDYVFDGNKGNYTEIDKTNPVNTYGQTKFQGEQEIKKHCKNHLILRTSVNFGVHLVKQSYATWVIKSLEQSKKIKVAKDHFNTPTLTDNLADVINEAVETSLEGLYHASGTERISRYEFALKIANKFSLPKHLIEPVEMEELKNHQIWTANRPSDSSLNTDKIRREIRTRIFNIDTALETMYTQLEVKKADIENKN